MTPAVIAPPRMTPAMDPRTIPRRADLDMPLPVTGPVTGDGLLVKRLEDLIAQGSLDCEFVLPLMKVCRSRTKQVKYRLV